MFQSIFLPVTANSSLQSIQRMNPHWLDEFERWSTTENWWDWLELNQRPLPYEGTTLTVELQSHTGCDRTRQTSNRASMM